MQRVRLRVLGRRWDAELADGASVWQLTERTGDGKRVPVELVVPAFVAADQLPEFIFDLVHESAGWGRSDPRIVRLPDEDAPLVGVLLAAGRGRRFDPSGHADKLLQPAPHGPHAGLPLAQAAALTLADAVDETIAVVRPDADERLAQLLRAAGCRLVTNPRADDGIGTSIACGVAARPQAAGWLIALADMPAVAGATIAAVAAALRDGAATAAPEHDGSRGHPVGFARSLAGELQALQGDRGARAVLERHPPLLLHVDDPGCLLDLDRPQDFERARPR